MGWQAFHELWRRIRKYEEMDDEPIAAELDNFRDVVLRRFDQSGVTLPWLVEWVSGARNISSDDAAWVSIEESITQVSALTPAKKKTKSPPPLRLDEISALLFAWVQELVEDYGRGSRSAKVFCVKEVARCTKQEACIHLGRSDWDVETAIRNFYMGNSTGDGVAAWSSGGARLSRNEIDCPICCMDYADGFTKVMTHCCFQVLCAACHRRLTDARGFLSCPFCRGVSFIPCEDAVAETRTLAGRGARRSSRESTSRRRHVARGISREFQSRTTSPQPRQMEDSDDEQPSFAVCSVNVRKLAPAVLVCVAYAICSYCGGTSLR